MFCDVRVNTIVSFVEITSVISRVLLIDPLPDDDIDQQHSLILDF